MKRLMFAMAIAATVGFAQAVDTPIGTTTDFDSLMADTPFSTAVNTDWTNNTDTEGPVEATVKAYDPADANNPNYLYLDGVQNLGKKINTEIGSSGLYIDTMVKFTATEDDAPTPGNEDKLVVWLKQTGDGDNATYTLMVTAGYINSAQYVVTPQTYETDATVVPDTWYNLKVKAIENADDSGSIDGGVVGFVVFIGGVAAKTSTCPADDPEVFGTSKYVDGTNDEYALFPSLIDTSTAGAAEITQLVFSGSGSIDTVGAFEGDCDPDDGPATEDWVDPTDPDAMAEITGKTVAQAYPSLTSLSANLKAADAVKLTTWATGVGKVDFADAAGINETAFLLGVANDETDLTLEPASIEIVNGKVVISANKDLEDVNGKVYIKTAEDLEDLASATWAEATLDDDGAVSLNAVEDASFYKIKVDF